MAQITLPTLVTISRLAAVPVVLVGMSIDNFMSPWIVLSAFCFAAWTDWLDGYLARRMNLVTELGKFLDPLVDKLLVLAPMLCFLEEPYLSHQIPAWSVLITVSRDLIISGWRVNQAVVPGASFWGKFKTVVQLCAMAGMLIPRSLPGETEEFWALVWLNETGYYLYWISLILVVYSAYVYLRPQSR